jgi:hypothetical protein
MPKVGGWEREQLGKTVPQPKGNFLMESTDLHFHGSDLTMDAPFYRIILIAALPDCHRHDQISLQSYKMDR